MTEDIGTTPRKPLTPKQRLALFETHKGMCCVCGRKIAIGEPWIDEHWRPLGLGGLNDIPSNRAPAHKACAAVKTKGDMAAITKAKAVKRKSLGIRPAGVQEIKSAGFPTFEKPSKISKEKIAKVALPPRSLFK